MKRLFLSLSLVTAALAVHAQSEVGSFSFIPRVGVTISSMSDAPLAVSDVAVVAVLKPQYKPGFVAGGDVQYQWTKDVAVSLGAYYALEGYHYKDYSSSSTEGNKYMETDYYDLSQNLGYIQVPLMAHVYVAKGLSLNAGLQAGFLVYAKWKSTLTSFTETTNSDGTVQRVYDKINGQDANNYKWNSKNKDDYKSVDLTLPLGLSYEYEHVVLDFRYNFPLTKAAKNQDSRNKSFWFTVGYQL